jgi:ligand-binding SRPBCC domain-containing protein
MITRCFVPRSPGTYLLQREQWVPRPVDEVFAFFADATNLEAITPPWLNFCILSPAPIAMRRGAAIVYRLRWHGLPLRWFTEIEEWEPPVRFVDVQRRGPYALWHHTHEFEPAGSGTRMRDLVRYALPLGPLGRLTHRLVVRRNLEAIFDYRAKKVTEIFGSRGERAGEGPPAGPGDSVKAG